MALNLALLILDEPKEGTKPNIVHQIGDAILHPNQAEGLTVLLVEQKLPFARRVARDFYIMEKKRMVATGATKTLHDGLIQQY